MNLTPKAMQIVQILLKQENSLTLQELAEEMKVSKRTVQREMGEVTGYFKNTGVDLITKMGTGVWLEGDVNEKKRLLSELQKTDSYDAGNREERRKRLILETLKEKELKTIIEEVKEEKKEPPKQLSKDALRREIAKVEKQITEKENELEDKRALRFEPEYYQDYTKMAVLDEEIDVIHNELAHLYEKWEQLQE